MDELREWFFAIIGAAVFIIGIIVRIRTRKKGSQCTSAVLAQIIEVRKHDDSWEDEKGRTHKDYSYHPVYYFVVGGSEYKVWSQYGCGRAGKFSVGDLEQINYNPQNPRQIYTKLAKKADRQFSFYIMFIGLLFIFVNTVVMLGQ